MGERNLTTKISNQYFENQKIDCMLAETEDADKKMDDFVIRLHETLDLYQLFDIFIDKLKTSLPCDGVEYKDKAINTTITNGIAGKHCCFYVLRYEDKVLGNISITRNDIFLEHEVETIEVLLAGLTLPLRNALRYQKAIKFMQRDELTGLRNGSYYHDVVDLEIKRAQRYKKPFSLLIIDVDNFDVINRQHGRSIGDAVLIEIANRINIKARTSDIVYRNGGDKFLVFLPNTENLKAVEAAERIKDFVLSKQFIIENNNIEFTVSAGAVTVTYEDTANKLMDRANKSLFHAKILGKNRVYGELHCDEKQAVTL